MESERSIFYTCPVCHLQGVMWAPESKLEKWRQGELIQNALPNHTPDERELLKTGTCRKCWEATFKD